MLMMLMCAVAIDDEVLVLVVRAEKATARDVRVKRAIRAR